MLALAEAAGGPQDGRGVARGLEAHAGARARRRGQPPLAVSQPERRAHRAPPAGAQSESLIFKSDLLTHWETLCSHNCSSIVNIVGVYTGKSY